MLQIPFFLFAVVALFGGVLSFMSPCTAVILPTFFAYTFKQKQKLFVATLIFFVGLAVVYIPLGLGFSFLSSLLPQTRTALGWFVGLFFLTFGVLSLTGKGLPELGLSKLLPNTSSSRGRGSFTTTFSLGLVTGLGTTPCTGPILGAIATLAALSGSIFKSAILMGLYTFGLFIPLLLVALLIDKVAFLRKFLAGKVFHFTIFGKVLQVHTTNFVAGVLFSILGVFFLVYGNSQQLTSIFVETGILGKTLDLQDALLDNILERN